MKIEMQVLFEYAEYLENRLVKVEGLETFEQITQFKYLLRHLYDSERDLLGRVA